MSPTPSTPFRFEFKYPMSITQARLLEQEIRQLGLAPDAFSTYDDGSYDVTSLYFDSYDFYDYDEKAGGFQERKKIRLRIYEPFLDKSEYGFLEIKHKYGMTNKKSKVKIIDIKYGSSVTMDASKEDDVRTPMFVSGALILYEEV